MMVKFSLHFCVSTVFQTPIYLRLQVSSRHTFKTSNYLRALSVKHTQRSGKSSRMCCALKLVGTVLSKKLYVVSKFNGDTVLPALVQL